MAALQKRVFQQESEPGCSAWEKLPQTQARTKRQASDVFEEDQFNALIPPKHRLWLYPRTRNTKNYVTALPKAKIPVFEGNGGTLSASNWLIQVSIVFFRDCGVPVEVAVEEIGRALPLESRARRWHDNLLADEPDITFDEFARAFLEEFSDTVDAAAGVNALLSFQQQDLDFETFVTEHGRLYWKVYPDKTSMDQLMDWGTRLNPLHQPIFKRFLAHRSEDSRLRSYNSALRWFRVKVEKLQPVLQTVKPTILAVTSPAQPTGRAVRQPNLNTRGATNPIPCNLGCYKKAHPEGTPCPALTRVCKVCNQLGHFTRSPLCSGKPAALPVVAALVPAVPLAAVPLPTGIIAAPQPLL